MSKLLNAPIQFPFLLFITLNFSSCKFLTELEQKSEEFNRYEEVSIKLAEDNRLLKVKIDKLKFDLKKAQDDKRYLMIKLEENGIENPIKKDEEKYSLEDFHKEVEKDFVQFEVYKWNAGQLLAFADDFFSKSDFQKSVQYYFVLIKRYPNDEKIDDQIYYRAGVSSYKTGHYKWTEEFLDKIVHDFPHSDKFRSSKLWLGLSYLKTGHEKDFFQIVEEFRKKYRNTTEWEIVSNKYEEIRNKYKH